VCMWGGAGELVRWLGGQPCSRASCPGCPVAGPSRRPVADTGHAAVAGRTFVVRHPAWRGPRHGSCAAPAAKALLQHGLGRRRRRAWWGGRGLHPRRWGRRRRGGRGRRGLCGTAWGRGRVAEPAHGPMSAAGAGAAAQAAAQAEDRAQRPPRPVHRRSCCCSALGVESGDRARWRASSWRAPSACDGHRGGRIASASHPRTERHRDARSPSPPDGHELHAATQRWAAAAALGRARCGSRIFPVAALDLLCSPPCLLRRLRAAAAPFSGPRKEQNRTEPN
jgi:hypothetical protein